jgi:hypothetical protein
MTRLRPFDDTPCAYHVLDDDGAVIGEVSRQGRRWSAWRCLRPGDDLATRLGDFSTRRAALAAVVPVVPFAP